MDIAIASFAQCLEALNMDNKIHDTRDVKWKRIYIKKDNCQYGRASFLNGVLYNVKWYCNHSNLPDFVEFDKVYFSVTIALSHRVLMSEQLWELLCKRAHLLKARSDAELKAARGALPARKRKKLRGYNVRKFLTYEGM